MLILQIAATIAVLMAPAPGDDKPVTIARAFKAGEEFRYSATAKMHLSGSEIAQTEVDQVRTKEVRPDGTAVFVYTPVSGEVIVNGQKFTLPQEPLTITVDRRDRLLSFEQPESIAVYLSPEVRQMMVAALQVVFPERPVAPNDNWSTELDNPAVKEKRIQVKTTYLGLEKLDGQPAWKVTQHTDAVYAPTAGSSLTCDMTAWLAPADGHALKYVVHFKNIPTQVGSVDSDSTSVEVKPGASTSSGR